MSFELSNISKIVDNSVHLDDITWSITKGQFNTLLGPTLSGKTSIMRILAGLDKPTSGNMLEDGTDITASPAKKRSVAMVYQQFINYPGFTVRQNIISPLNNLKLTKDEIEERLINVSKLLKLEDYLDRKPLALSGGQQQRVALARALAKQSDLILLDEPLANLDYKLREELRSELPKIFKNTNSTVVYATTEPEEALLLGGNLGVLDKGRLIESGAVLELYQHPKLLDCAKGLSDPPLNILNVTKRGSLIINDAVGLKFDAPDKIKAFPDGEYIIALRPHHLDISTTQPLLNATIKGSDITGSETYLHLKVGDTDWTLLKHGVHSFMGSENVGLSFSINHMMLFDMSGQNMLENGIKMEKVGQHGND